MITLLSAFHSNPFEGKTGLKYILKYGSKLLTKYCIAMTDINPSVIIKRIITVWETGEVHTGFWWRNLRERDHLEDLGVDGKITLK